MGTPARRGERPPSAGRWAAPALALAAGACGLAAGTAGMLAGVEPFASWYYAFAWYSTLLLFDGAVALGTPGDGGGRFPLLGRPAYAVTLLAWSSLLWLFFELLNFRLRDWYYVFVPADPLARRLGILLAFATVLPALFTAEALLASLGVGRRARWPALRVTPRLLRAMTAAGAAALLLPLVWPRLFFPLVWVALALLLEPVTYRRAPCRSLLGDLQRGEPGRLLRLLLSGALIGLLWELYNAGARTKWIYTVPGFEELKLFEMPVAGFLGFPPFALECFAVWQALVVAGLAVPRNGRVRPASKVARIGAAAAAAVFVACVMAGIEARTVSSYSPRLADLPGVPAAALVRAGYDVFSLSAATPGEAARAAERAGGPGADFRQAREWVEAARLAALRGIGTANARLLRRAGIRSVGELAAADPERLAGRLAELSRESVPAARVQVWVRAARRAD